MRLYTPSRSEDIARLHGIEWADDWQYAVVWRFAGQGDPLPVLRPADGEWELNTDYREGAQYQVTPRWSDGSVVMQFTRWRRPWEGMRPSRPKQTVHERVKWDGDPRP